MAEYTFALDQAVRPVLQDAVLDGGAVGLLASLTADPTAPDVAHAARLAGAAYALASAIVADPGAVAGQLRRTADRVTAVLEAERRREGVRRAVDGG